MKALFTTKSDYRTRLFLCLFLLMIVFVLLVNLINYLSFKATLEDNAVSSNIATVRVLRNAVERTIADVQDSLVKVVSDTSAEYFMTLYHNRDEYIVEILEAMERLKAKVAYSKYYSGCYILYEEDGVVLDITQGRVLKRDEMTSLGSDRKYLENNAQIIDQVMAKLDGSRDPADLGMRIYNLDTDHKRNVLTFVKPIRVAPSIVLFITIDQDYFDQMLNAVKSNANAEVMLIDENGAPVTQRPASFPDDMKAFSPENLRVFQTENEGNFLADVDGRECLVTFVRSAAYGWRFAYAEPSADVFAAVSSMRWQVVILILACAVTVMMLSFIFAGRIYRPIKQLVDEIDQCAPDVRQPDEHEIEHIRTGISRLALQNERIAATLAQNLPVLKNAALNNLLSNKLSEDPRTILESYRAEILPNARYVVFVCSVDAPDGESHQPGVWEATLIEIVRAAFADTPHTRLETVQRYTDGTVFILSLLSESDDEAYRVAREGVWRVHEESHRQMPCTMSIGVGRLCHSIDHLHRSYGDASSALAYRTILGSDRVIAYDDVPRPQQWYYIYPFEVEKRLFLLLKSGDMPGVSKALMDYIRYIIDHDISPQEDRYVFIHLLDNTIKCCVEMGLDVRVVLNEHDNLYRELLDISDITQIRRWFEDIDLQIIQYLQIKRDTRSEETAERIRAYIDEHYASPEVSMAALSEELHYSESHLSKVFRVTYNDTVKQYLTKIRLERACKLLADTDMRIKEIAEAVGYPNTQAFLKIFKKMYGETPSEYQEHRYR